MERRVLLAILLSFLVLYGYQALFGPKPDQAPPARPPDSRAESVGAPAPSPSPSPAQRPAQPAAAVPLVADIKARIVTVETEDVRAEFSTQGAVLTRWQLKKYRDDNGGPVDLIPQVPVTTTPRAFGLSSAEDASLAPTLQGALFKPSAESLRLRARTPGTVTFEFQDASGLAVKKTFTMQKDGHPYVLGFDAAVTRHARPLNATIHGGPGIGETARSSSGGSFMFGNYYQPPEAIFVRPGERVTRIAAASLGEQPHHAGAFRYVGVDDQYFLGVLVSGGKNARVEYRVMPVQVDGASRQLVRYAARFDEEPGEMRAFFGPKDYDALTTVDPELKRVINFGYFFFLVEPLLRALKWVNRYVGNYGWSIVILTVLINLAILPLRHKSVVSMRKMQGIQPQVKAIQDRYAKLKATDPARQKMSTELMNLYREKGVNPASGCVPMLLTLPILFAFYALLSQAIELRGAPFALWIKDLSRHDPYYVTPLLMGASMVWQQRMTPMPAADPVQQRMLTFMPVMFTVFFLWAPSGLVIYWLLSNVWTIGQQYLTTRLIGPPPQAIARPAAERRVKQAGAGKTEDAKGSSDGARKA
jgi:YidC/Oxa1 family membrane protein insertase